MRNALWGFVAMVLALSGIPAYAEDADAAAIADVRCLLVGFTNVNSSEPARQAAGMMVSLYFLGRLRARVPQVDIEAIILKQSETITDADLSSEAKRCGADLSDASREMSQLRKGLMEHAKQCGIKALYPDPATPTSSDHQ